MISIENILEILPHRYPFILIDRIESLDPAPEGGNWVGRKCKSIKGVTMNEQFFTGHFPGKPIMPGVLVIEAMAQTAAICAYRPARPDSGPQEVMILGVDQARFRKPVVPGDRLAINVEITKDRGSLFSFHCEAYVDDQLVAEADILAKSFPKKEGK